MLTSPLLTEQVARLRKLGPLLRIVTQIFGGGNT